MIKSTVAFTVEIDNPEAAAAEITAQIKDSIVLMRNSVGIVNCHTAFLETGALRAICGALPFPVCGLTTSINGGGPVKSARLGSGELFLTLMVLTSDDIRFDVAVSDEITPIAGRAYGGNNADLANNSNSANHAHNEHNAAAQTAIKAAFSDNKTPDFVCVFAPTIELISGDDLVNAFNEIAPGVPLFGGFAVDDSPRYTENVFSIMNGEAFRNKVAFIKFFGDVKPIFYTATISRQKIGNQFAVVTGSNGTEIFTVNNRPVTEYLEAFGLNEPLLEEKIVTNFALIIEDGDGYYARAMLRLTPEKTLICGGEIAEGARVRIGQFDKDDTIASGKNASELTFLESANVVLAVSSIARATILGSDIFCGIDTVRESSGGTPFIMSYTAGEINSQNIGDKYVNRFNNQSFNACAF
jgi:hypothetical protein